MATYVMKRYEMKYLLNAQQTAFLKERLAGHMEKDKYGMTSIASLYYDTPGSKLIRASIEKPEFKEKIRLRSYGLATDESPVYLELKRKAYGIVYKRRVKSNIPDVESFLAGDDDILADGQISREITAFRDFYKTLVPACLIIYDRTAYLEPDGDLRLTIDHRPRYRMDDLSLKSSMNGIPLLDNGWTILEIKVQDAMPLWLTEILSEGRIYKCSFSKYGEAYRRQVLGSRTALTQRPLLGKTA
ncbi:MAG: polyphosphate polymerase domain-containing protein [Ruminiclostridium sp.]|nr:polyphosphate polymerase domain-containing protein [Ruminiclostridium sp.]